MRQNSKTLPDFESAKLVLIDKFEKMQINDLAISDYSKNYLSFLVNDLWETLGRFEQVLTVALLHSEKSASESTVVDYGGGVGLLTLLAKQAGFCRVVYNDIFEGSCQDVRILAESASLEIDAIIQGDATNLVASINRTQSHPDLIVSYDVIEHVYSVEENFLAFKELGKAPEVIVYGSGANIKNPFYVHQVTKTQKAVEFEGRLPHLGHKPSDSLDSYLEIRKQTIQQLAPSLSDREVDSLARQTRGLINGDIALVLREFQRNGKISYHMDHPTNTCDPLTGNWCEHLLDFDWLRSTAVQSGYRVTISKGRYSPTGIRFRSIQRALFNLASSFWGKFGFVFSPFYILVLKPQAAD